MALLAPIKQQELSINEYVASIGLNPSNVYYARYSSTNVSPQQLQFSIQTPGKRNVLLSFAQVEYNVKFVKDESTTNNAFDFGNDAKWQDEVPYVSFKNVFPFAGATSSATVSINGTTQTHSQVRHYMEQLSALCVSQEEAYKCFQSGYMKDSGGIWPTPASGNRTKAISVDEGLMKNEEYWQNQALEGAGETKFDNTWGDAVNGTSIFHTEPLVIPPFNPFAKVMSGIPNYLWFKKMSHVIPNIDRLNR